MLTYKLKKKIIFLTKLKNFKTETSKGGSINGKLSSIKIKTL